MATGVQDWSTTPGSNATADSGINWSEGQLGPTVNNSARGMMASIKAWANTIGGGVSYGGSGNAYTITNNAPGAWASLAAPRLIMLKANHTNSGAAIDSMTDAVDVTKDIASGNILGAIFKSLDKNKAEKFARQSAEVHNEIVRLISMPVEQAQKELGKYGGASGWLRSRSALERARILAERRANQPALNAKLMQEALGSSGLYGGVGGADLGTFFGEILSPPDRY